MIHLECKPFYAPVGWKTTWRNVTFHHTVRKLMNLYLLFIPLIVEGPSTVHFPPDVTVIDLHPVLLTLQGDGQPPAGAGVPGEAAGGGPRAGRRGRGEGPGLLRAGDLAQPAGQLRAGPLLPGAPAGHRARGGGKGPSENSSASDLAYDLGGPWLNAAPCPLPGQVPGGRGKQRAGRRLPADGGQRDGAAGSPLHLVGVT